MPTQEQTKDLLTQTFDLSGPGTVLADFETLLDFVGPGGVPARGKHHLLPMDSLAELNSRMREPLIVKLQRPQLRSFPNLQALHLLGRATGLLSVAGGGEKARLVTPPDLLEIWRSLNCTEQYFTLLEAWLLRATPEMLGEGGGGINHSWHINCLTAWTRIPKEGIRFPKKDKDCYYLITTRFYQVWLLAMFGMARIKQTPADSGQPWYPAAIFRTPFGEGLTSILRDAGLGPWIDPMTVPPPLEPVTYERPIGFLQRYAAPQFPEWKNNFFVPPAPARTGTFTFKVSLNTMWRRIAISAEHSLEDLSDAILNSIRFDREHLYCFSYRNRFGRTVEAMSPDRHGELYTTEVPLRDLPLEPGDEMRYVFDFSDEWEFSVKLERIDRAEKPLKRPKVTEKHGPNPRQYDSNDW